MTPYDYESAVSALCGRHADGFRIRRLLHTVPPHCVAEVDFAGERAVCKVSLGERGRAGVEGRVLQYVDRETSVPVPTVLATGDTGFVAEYRPDSPTSDRSAVEATESEDGQSAADDDTVDAEWLCAAGRTLATLHDEATFARSGLLEAQDGVPETDSESLSVGRDGLSIESPGTWPAALDAQLTVYEDALAATGFADVAREARTFVEEYADRFALPDEWRASLLHGWFSPEHVGIREGSAACVVDFEHALFGSPEWDYWRTVVPLFSSDGWSVPDDGRAVFREAYESVRPLPPGTDDREPAYRALLAVSYLDSLHAQRCIDDATRDRAEFFRERATEAFGRLRQEWSG
jgi:hypothetical protein